MRRDLGLSEQEFRTCSVAVDGNSFDGLTRSSIVGLDWRWSLGMGLVGFVGLVGTLIVGLKLLRKQSPLQVNRQVPAIWTDFLEQIPSCYTRKGVNKSKKEKESSAS